MCLKVFLGAETYRIDISIRESLRATPHISKRNGQWSPKQRAHNCKTKGVIVYETRLVFSVLTAHCSVSSDSGALPSSTHPDFYEVRDGDRLHDISASCRVGLSWVELTRMPYFLVWADEQDATDSR
jgi:hypothetical protein